MDRDPYSGALWIGIRIQELCGSGSVFRSFVDRDHLHKYGTKYRIK